MCLNMQKSIHQIWITKCNYIDINSAHIQYCLSNTYWINQLIYCLLYYQLIYCLLYYQLIYCLLYYSNTELWDCGGNGASRWDQGQLGGQSHLSCVWMDVASEGGAEVTPGRGHNLQHEPWRPGEWQGSEDMSRSRAKPAWWEAPALQWKPETQGEVVAQRAEHAMLRFLFLERIHGIVLSISQTW